MVKKNWFARFRSGDFEPKDAPCSGRPTKIDDGEIKAMIENNRRSTTREIAEKLKISRTCVERYLKQLGYVNKLDIWVPHKLKEIQLTKRMYVCDSLLKRNETDPFSKRIITDDEKWVVYDNVVRKRSWSKRDDPARSISNADIHQKKVMLNVWWDSKGIVNFELLPGNHTINSKVYYRQLMELDKEIKEKRPELSTHKGVIFHQDNARPHTSLVTCKKLLELGWEVMPDTQYNPDLAQSDYHLFRTLQNHLNGKIFDSNEAVKNKLIQFFASKNQTFYESGIMKLTCFENHVIKRNDFVANPIY